jgi:hypothetical protein
VEPRTRRTLTLLARRFETRVIPFQLGGSGLLFAHGRVDRVGDLDLVFPEAARPGLEQVLVEQGGAVPRFDASQEPGFVSAWRCRYELDGQELDLSGAITLVIEGRRIPLPFIAGGFWDLDGVNVPLAPLEQWALIYRVHKPERALLFEDLVDPEAWSCLCRRAGIPEDWRRAT